MSFLNTLTQQEFVGIQTYVLNTLGINLAHKKSLIFNRLINTVRSGGYKSFGAYFSHVKRDKTGRAVQVLTNKLTTNHTFFYREKSHFSYLKEHVLPELVEKRHVSASSPLKIWCAGCSTGEEPYTLAIEISHYLGEKNPINFSIFASDISSSVLEKANKGIYNFSRLIDIPRNMRSSYFSRLNSEQVQVKDIIRNKVKFKRINLKQNEFDLLGEYHIIFCRNVMIYFQTMFKLKLLTQFHSLTRPGGYLFVGHSESLNYPDNPYLYLKPSIYKKEAI